MNPFESINQCAQKALKEPMSIGAALTTMGDTSFTITCVLLCLPFLQPIALGPIAIAGGVTFLALGWQMMQGRAVPWLPEKVLNITLNEKTWGRILWICTRLMKVVTHVSRPRMQSWVSTERAKKRLGLLISVAGFLMTLPMFGIPFNNTLPALVVLSTAIGEIEEDGLWILVSLFFLLATIIYFAIIGWAILKTGSAILSSRG